MPASKPFVHRDGIHIHHDYQPTQFPRRHAKCRGGASGQVAQSRTRMTVKRPSSEADWRIGQDTAKTRQVRRRAERWNQRTGRGR